MPTASSACRDSLRACTLAPPVEVELLRRPEEVRNTIVAIGSHDLTLDLLASFIARNGSGLSLSSSNVGSLGGLIALQRGEAHLAGSHLLDEESGEYNLSYVKQHLAERGGRDREPRVPRAGADRAAGQSEGHSRARRPARPDVQFVNRQRGAGTRVLLDYKLRQIGLDPSQIRGYEREEYTHLAAAAAVMSGAADVGLGILAAARALKLEFVPLLKERYDLVVPREYYESDLLAALLAIIRGEEFRREVEALGGYDTSEMGRVLHEL